MSSQAKHPAGAEGAEPGSLDQPLPFPLMSSVAACAAARTLARWPGLPGAGAADEELGRSPRRMMVSRPGLCVYKRILLLRLSGGGGGGGGRMCLVKVVNTLRC